MGKDIKKIKCMADLASFVFSKGEEEFFRSEISNWHKCLAFLRNNEDTDQLLMALAYELQHAKRPAVLDRIRTRYNKVRVVKELKEIEAIVGKVININYV
jgi:hypothetical protein